MRSANKQNLSTDGRETVSNPATARERASLSYSDEEREVVRRGLRILARIIVAAHLRRQTSRSGAEAKNGTRERTGMAAPEPPAEGEARE